MLRSVVIITMLAACSFLGSLVGSHYLHSSPARAAAVKKGPSPTVLAARIGALSRRVERLAGTENRLSGTVTSDSSRIDALTSRVNTLDGEAVRACGAVGFIQAGALLASIFGPQVAADVFTTIYKSFQPVWADTKDEAQAAGLPCPQS